MGRCLIQALLLTRIVSPGVSVATGRSGFNQMNRALSAPLFGRAVFILSVGRITHSGLPLPSSHRTSDWLWACTQPGRLSTSQAMSLLWQMPKLLPLARQSISLPSQVR